MMCHGIMCRGFPLQARGEGTYIHPNAQYGWGWGIRSKQWETLNAALRRSIGLPGTELLPGNLALIQQRPWGGAHHRAAAAAT